MAIETQGTIPAATPTTTYTSSDESAVTFMSICNRHTGPINVDVHIVKSGFTAGVSNILISQLEIVADDTYIIYQGGEKLILENGDFISVTSDVGSVATVITSYVAV